MNSLLAKGIVLGRQDVTLLTHTQDVCKASNSLFGSAISSTRLGSKWLKFFRVDSEVDSKNFHWSLRAACLLHDIGKANADMQSVLRRENATQLFRHEHLSVMLLHLPNISKWLNRREDIDWPLVAAAVGSHHLKFREEDFRSVSKDRTVRLFTDHCEFKELLNFLGDQLAIGQAPRIETPLHWGFVRDSFTFDPRELRESICRGPLRELDLAAEEANRARLLTAVRAALIVADGAASGLRRIDQSIEAWIQSCFDESAANLCSKESVEKIILDRLVELRLKGDWKAPVAMQSEGWNQFQRDCDSLPSQAGLLAPCGSGKTLAAWRWIASRPELPVKRILFLYPTRATATEGFKDYVSWAPESKLLHGTASYDLEGMFPAEDPRSGSLLDGSDPRLFAIQHWDKRVFSATIDQFFSFMSYSYGAMCLLPLLADSVVVLDEVHSFDDKMFSAVLGFLRNFDVPILCMTATLQSGRLEQLGTVVNRIYNDKPEQLVEIAGAPRYQVKRTTEREAHLIAKQSVDEGLRVLWVVNQVSRAQSIATLLEQQCDVDIICYHSRFKLRDRRDRHQETVERVRRGKGKVIAVSTQVCEMSLDIDADVLITEECPISSLIQRMGRCRRGRLELFEKGAGRVYIYKPDEKERVYDRDDLFGLSDFVDKMIHTSPVSQLGLENGMQAFGSKHQVAERRSSFFTSGSYAISGEDSFRDIDEYSQPCVLDDDLDEFLGFLNHASTKSKTPAFICPVPKKLKPPPSNRLPSYLRVGKSIHYSTLTGYHDHPIKTPCGINENHKSLPRNNLDGD